MKVIRKNYTIESVQIISANEKVDITLSSHYREIRLLTIKILVQNKVQQNNRFCKIFIAGKLS